MGFFDRYYYGKAGQADYTENNMPKTRMALFGRVLKDHLFDLVKVNLLQVVFWVPFLLWTCLSVVNIMTFDPASLGEQASSAEISQTLSSYVMVWLLGAIPCVAITGPSSAGAAYVMRNWARDQHSFVMSDYFDALKANWKQALPVSVFTGVVPAVAFTAMMVYGQMLSSNLVMIVPFITVLFAALMFTLMLPLIYPMIIGYELRLGDIIKNALLLSAAKMPTMLFARIVTFIPVAVLMVGIYLGNTIALMGVSAYYMLFGFAFSRLVYASVANGVFDQYLNPKIEGAPTRVGLRPEDPDEMDLDDEDDEEDEEPEDEDAE